MATKTTKTTKATDLPAEARKLASAEYAREAKTGAAFYLPGPAAKRIGEKLGVPAAKLRSYVDPVYFEANGRRNPIALPAKRTPLAIARAVRKRRDGGTTLGRWESVAASLSETLGRPVSETAVRALYEKGGGDPETSYVGRGTRVGAPATRTDAAVEVEAVATK